MRAMSNWIGRSAAATVMLLAASALAAGPNQDSAVPPPAAGSAAAAPWDGFPLIMWQSRTAAQIEGLKRLGFTGLKLTASGGHIDPAALQVGAASGLPWYLENIASDFFAPYHRYTPGKPVNWLFDAAKARRRANPADTSVFLREPSLGDPAWQAAIAARLTSMVHDQSRYHPLFYNLADESGIGDLAAAWDADIAPSSLDGMRSWLRTQYPDLPALNQEWGTGFARWEDVVPELTDAAMARHDDNYAAWADFKAWMDVAFATAVRHATDAIHTADPTALAGLEGGQVPGWGGYDYGRLAPTVDVMELYDVGNAQDLARAFNPGLRLLRTSSGIGPRETHAAWHALLHGGRGMIVWDDKDDVVRPDGTPTPRGLDIAARVADLHQVAKVLSGATPQRDPVAVLYSQASFRTHWMLDHRELGSAWSGRDAEREYEDNAWRASRRQTLQRLSEIGVEPYILTSAMVEAGALRDNGLRVLILPQTIAMSQAEADAITDFAAHGGTVLTDAEAGLFDQHSRRRAAPLLEGVAKLEPFLWPDGNASAPDNLDPLADALRRAGAAPRLTLRGPDGATAAGVDVQWFVQGDTTILTLQTQIPWGSATEFSLHLSQPALVHDLRHPAPPQRTDQIAVHLDGVEPTILVLGSDHR
jgi:hypothetical protein